MLQMLCVSRVMRAEVHMLRGDAHFFLHLLHKQLLSQSDTFVLRFYGLVNPMGSCRARSVYLSTPLLGRLSPLSG